MPEVTVKNRLSPIEKITSKAPQDFNTFVLSKNALLDEGGDIGEKFVLEKSHGIYDNLWISDHTIMIYTYPGKIQHSSYIIQCEKNILGFLNQGSLGK